MEQQLQTAKEDLESRQVEIVRLQSTIEILSLRRKIWLRKLPAGEGAQKGQSCCNVGQGHQAAQARAQRALNENVELRAEIQDLESDRDKLIGAVEELHEEARMRKKRRCKRRGTCSKT